MWKQQKSLETFFSLLIIDFTSQKGVANLPYLFRVYGIIVKMLRHVMGHLGLGQGGIS